MIENVLANPDKETAKLIRAAQEDYESEYFFHTQVCDVCECYLDIPEYVFLSIFWLNVFSCPSELPANEKLHDLVSLLNFDSTKVSGEMLGEESIQHHQWILQEHWGSGDMVVLPGDDVQHLLLRVSISQDGFLEHQFFLQILFIEILLAGDSNDITSISGQLSTRTSASSWKDCDQFKNGCPQNGECGIGRDGMWEPSHTHQECVWVPKKQAEYQAGTISWDCWMWMNQMQSWLKAWPAKKQLL